MEIVLFVGGACYIGIHLLVVLRQSGYYDVMYDDFNNAFKKCMAMIDQPSWEHHHKQFMATPS